MFKKVLFLFLLPSLSWGATCVVPIEKMDLDGMRLGQSVSDFSSKHKGMAIVKVLDEYGESREGRLEFKDFNNNYKKFSGIGPMFIGHIAYNKDEDEITSFSIAPMDYSLSLSSIRNKFMNKVNIPQSLWVNDKEKYGEYRYLCDDYEVKINQNDDRGEISLILRSSLSEEYNLIEIKYSFSAMQFITPKVQKQILNEGIEYSNYDLYSNDPLFRSRLNEVFFKRAGLEIEDFDMGSGLSARDITDGIITTSFYQKNESSFKTKLDMYIAYQPYNNHMLVVIKDTDDNIKVYGNKDKLLISAMIKSREFPINLASNIK